MRNQIKKYFNYEIVPYLQYKTFLYLKYSFLEILQTNQSE